MDIYAVLTALAATVNAIDGGPAAYPILPPNVEAPAFGAEEIELAYHQTFANGLTSVPLTLLLLTSMADVDAGRQLMSTYISPGSPTNLQAAIEADRTLGGTCSTLIVDRVRNAFKQAQVADTQYIAAEIDVRVWGT